MQRTLFTFAIFLSAFLLFLIQPMMSKQFLPHLGGSTAVWQTAMLFYQVMLLAGYAYAHFAPRWLGENKQRKLHILLLLISLGALPIVLQTASPFAPTAQPVAWLLYALLLSVGLPFFALAANSPLLQHWFARTDHPAANNPYFLYSASNLGSFLALMGYPFVVEPLLDIPAQSGVWSGLYSLFVFVLLVIAFSGLHKGETPAADIVEEDTAPTPLTRKIQWLFLAALPSSLMLGLTSYVTADLGAIPLLWVIPLALYLLSFVLCFHPRMPLYAASIRMQVPLVLLLVLVMGLALDVNLLAFKALHFIVFFVVAMSLHGQLAKLKPASNKATEFYLWIALGGAVGGCFNVLVAPQIFVTAKEYVLALALSCLHRPRTQDTHEKREHVIDYAFPLAAYLLFMLLQTVPPESGREVANFLQDLTGIGNDISLWVFLLYVSFPIAAWVLCRHRPMRFALSVVVLMLFSPFEAGPPGAKVLLMERNFFGIGMVMRDDIYRVHSYHHGTTRHGAQSTDEAYRLALSMYYYPLTEITAALHPEAAAKPIAGAGLGVGTMTCAGKAGQRFDIFEIDQAAKDIAEDTRYFTYLRDCPADTHVYIADARIGLQQQPPQTYGLMLMDAYSSDFIPLHLLTREALTMYLDKLAPHGLIAFHISNRYYDLAPVIARLARDAGVVAITKRFDPPENNPNQLYSTAFWVLVAREREDFGALVGMGWNPLTPDTKRAWSDHYSNAFEAIRWND